MESTQIFIVVCLCLFAYLMGSVPFGYIVGQIKKVDIQKSGSGNIGATNIGRKLGFWYALIVGFLDAFKAALPVIIAVYFFHISLWAVGLVLLCAVAGAVFSVWLGFITGSFRAGKGVAAMVGGLLILAEWQWLIVIGCWLISLRFFFKRKVSAASLVLALSVIFLIPVIPTFPYMIPTLLVMIGIIWWAHRENIKRIIGGKEPSVSLKLKLPKKTPDFIRKNLLKINDVTDDVFGWLADKFGRPNKKT